MVDHSIFAEIVQNPIILSSLGRNWHVFQVTSYLLQLPGHMKLPYTAAGVNY